MIMYCGWRIAKLGQHYRRSYLIVLIKAFISIVTGQRHQPKRSIKLPTSSQNATKNIQSVTKFQDPYCPTSRTTQIQYNPCEDSPVSLIGCPCFAAMSQHLRSEQCIRTCCCIEVTSACLLYYSPVLHLLRVSSDLPEQFLSTRVTCSSQLWQKKLLQPMSLLMTHLRKTKAILTLAVTVACEFRQ